ncbi:MAG TPA: M4 family metallopeptidase [Bacteroidales bacterium]|nr:M4 family metallopeptidase [Bacteroidales bacterium]HPT52285.1 M4 family metallopeptidase [Bacteroidales bacterium]
MKKITLFLIAIIIGLGGFAQQSSFSEDNIPNELQKIATFKNKGKIIQLKENYQIPANIFFEKYYSFFGLKSAQEMVLKEEITHLNGNKSYRFGQECNGVPVAGATIILHEKNGVVTYLNGLFISNLSLPTTPFFTSDAAIALALETVPATTYAWQISELEQDIKNTTKDINATYYPTPKLLFFDQNYSNNAKNYRLTYEIEVFSIEPLNRQILYIDALTGEIVKNIKKNQNANVEVQAKTRYNGIQTITVDSVSPTQFVLRENSRGTGNGILTRSLNNAGSLYETPIDEAVDVVESDNFFDTDSVANNAHFGAEKTYDYYFEKFGRNSINAHGQQLVSYVHLGQNVENAMWSQDAMFYGDGANGYPFTFLSVCGHEITHGLTENTANLVYEYESGALNESFSDMFGAMIAYYASDTLKWTIGDEINQPFRDMSNPNAYQNPDTYLGTYWVTGADDNGGVHNNSGVANYWFYLLCEGGQGVNDIGNSYSVTPIGTEKAETIAYTLLTTQLVETSDYQNTYELSLIVAEDLYGECSPEVISVAEAWYAVGIGYRFSDTNIYVTDILSPATDCALSNAEEVHLEFTYNSCDMPLPAGTEIFIKAILDQTTEIYDTITLVNNVQPAEIVELTLSTPIDVSAIGAHRLDAFIKTNLTNDYTDSLINYQFNNLLQQNEDVKLIAITSPESSCHLDDHTAITVSFTFDICDSIEAGTPIPLAYLFIGSIDTVRENFILPTTVRSGDVLSYTFQQTGDFTQRARNTVRVIAENPGDPNSSNNTATKIIIRPTFLNTVSQFTFNESDATNYYYLESEDYATVSVGSLSGYPNGKLLKMSGGNAMDYYSEIEFPQNDDLWSVNDKMNARATFCADATNYAQLAVQFDLKQTSGKETYEQLLGGDAPADYDFLNTSMMRVLVDGTPVGNTFTPATAGNDPFTTRAVNLCDYIGAVHSITFESKCMSGDLYMYVLDHVYIDNIAILETDHIDLYNNPTITLSVYPNPATSTLSVELSDNETSRPIEYLLLDIYGKEIMKGMMNNGQNTINISNLSNGIYLLKVVSDRSLIGTGKIIKE